MGESATNRRSFAWLNVTQFFGALNDNVFQMLVIFFLTYLAVKTGGPAVDAKAAEARIIATAGVIFVLPFILFSHAAGVLADRFSKRNIIVSAKIMELAVMLCGLAAVTGASRYAGPILYAMIFVMCAQSTLFGPSKFGIIPEIVSRDSLSRANSYLIGLTYLAIILGTFLPSFITDKLFPDNYPALAMVCVCVSAVGLVGSLGIEKTVAVGNRRPFSLTFPVEMFKTLRRIRTDRYLLLAVIALAYFLGLGAFIKFNLLLYGQQHLGLTQQEAGYLFPVAALGIGLGALVAGKLSGRNIEFGVVPVGAAGLTLCCIAFALLPYGSIVGACVLACLVGVSCGLYIVPLNAFIQQRSPRQQLGEIIACQNFLGFLAVAVSMGIFWLLTAPLDLSASLSFLAAGVLTGILAAGTFTVLPDFFMRFCIIVITRLFYRIRASGLENVPTHGAALLVPNHVTYIDALLIGATIQRRIRFLMARDNYEKRWLNPLFRLMGVIPISPEDPPRQIVESLRRAREELDRGYLVCIFAEGALTRNGNPHAFRPGLERILKGSSHPVIPVHIGGAWGSIFSHYHGHLLSTWPRAVPYPVSLAYGQPMPAGTTTAQVRQAVLELSATADEHKKTRRRNLAWRVAAMARRRWSRLAMTDTTGKSLSFGRMLAGVLVLARVLRKRCAGQDMVGIVLPASVGGALTNMAITLMGKVPVNLNFTASAAAVASAVRQCGIRTVITSRAFAEKLDKFERPGEPVYLEDLMAAATPGMRFGAFLAARFAPLAWLGPGVRSDPDSMATIIFSSGSTGDPKGVMLSHHNILSNLESFSAAFRFGCDDRICGVLPFFHSFGFTCTLWCPAVAGFGVDYHPNPLDGSRIAELVRECRCTILLSTPTFLLAYVRRAKPEDFASLRAVVVGAEKLKTRIADAFEKRFGLRPLEGYGATELSPVVSLNLPDRELAGVRQVGTKEGSIGHPIPGIAVRIVDPDTHEERAVGEEGLLLIKGPNVMLGYLGNEEKTAEVLQDGWYDTGDIARMDEDGFIFLLDRLSRYSKIGGEMVPHIAVEEAILQSLRTVNPVVAVTSAPDERKGEQLVVLYVPEAGDAATLQAIVQDSELPNLWRPKKENYHPIDAMPLLGSGKLDLKRIKQMAKEFVQKRGQFVDSIIR